MLWWLLAALLWALIIATPVLFFQFSRFLRRLERDQ